MSVTIVRPSGLQLPMATIPSATGLSKYEAKELRAVVDAETMPLGAVPHIMPDDSDFAIAMAPENDEM